ncbi:hypothetical protein, partial [Bacillus sp. V33-4]
ESPYSPPMSKLRVLGRMAYDTLFVTKVPAAYKSIRSFASSSNKKVINFINSIKGTGNDAKNIFNYELLKKDLKYTERYGSQARKELQDGRIRYYGEIQPATKPGEMIGRRTVQELNPRTGNVRTWLETLDGSGKIRQVRPQLGAVKKHYMFDESGNLTKKW